MMATSPGTKAVVMVTLTFGALFFGVLSFAEVAGLLLLCIVPLFSVFYDLTLQPKSAYSPAFFSVAFAVWAYYSKPSLFNFISGGVGGVFLAFVGQPMDNVKTKLQTSKKFSWTWECLQHIIRVDGVAGLYKGLSAPLVGNAPVFAICFWGYAIGADMVRLLTGKASDEALGLWEIALAGGFSAVPTTVLMAPMERIKLILQTQPGPKDEPHEEGDMAKPREMPYFDSMTDCATWLVRNQGIGSLFKGWELTLLRDVPGSVAYFAVYEVVKDVLSGGDPAKLALWMTLCAGGLAGCALWLVAIPPDALKTRYTTAHEGHYSGISAVYKELMAEGGFGALYSGITPVLLRAFPANAACFVGVELAKAVLAQF
mmetsp:Transcript_20793/g.32822  ORF Transcript_20793/g.32822 Transcript_20793/m.32822 type:complete len:371 (-) Transcript_20793:159-1271(-)